MGIKARNSQSRGRDPNDSKSNPHKRLSHDQGIVIERFSLDFDTFLQNYKKFSTIRQLVFQIKEEVDELRESDFKRHMSRTPSKMEVYNS